MPSTAASIIVSAASAVGKTFLIGATGYYAVKRPVANPYLPKSSINMLSRFSFYILILPLIYTGVASSVTLESLSSLWFVVLASMVIIAISYLVATILAYLPFFRVYEEENFNALRIAISFPNIVALPIIIFPALCEFEVFHEYGEIGDETVSSSITLQENIAQCEVEANTVVFTYFFGFNILFWSFGYRTLKRLQISQPNNDDFAGEEPSIRQRTNGFDSMLVFFKRSLFLSYEMIKDILISPGFMIMLLSFATACVKSLQDALFVPGGALRVIGSTLESLTGAGATMATIVVAAALADDTRDEENTVVESEHSSNNVTIYQEQMKSGESRNSDVEQMSSTNSNNDAHEQEHTLILQQDNQGTSKSFFRKIVEHPTFKVQVWHVVARLFVTPAVVFGMLLKLDCIINISPIAKLVLLINSSLPGALVVVVILKANGCTKAASIVSQTYLPSYTLSVITIAAWASVGMMAFSSALSSC